MPCPCCSCPSSAPKWLRYTAKDGKKGAVLAENVLEFLEKVDGNKLPYVSIRLADSTTVATERPAYDSIEDLIGRHVALHRPPGPTEPACEAAPTADETASPDEDDFHALELATRPDSVEEIIRFEGIVR